MLLLRGHAPTPPLPFMPCLCAFRSKKLANTGLEIYRIVSSKALDQGEGSQNVLGVERQKLEISKSADEGQKKNGCC